MKATELERALEQRMSLISHEVQQVYPHPAGVWRVPRSVPRGAPTLEEAAKLDEAESAARARRVAEHR